MVYESYITLCLFCWNLLLKKTQSGFVTSWNISNQTMSNSNVGMQGFHSTVNSDCIYIFGGDSDNGCLNCFNTSNQQVYQLAQTSHTRIYYYSTLLLLMKSIIIPIPTVKLNICILSMIQATIL